jgi:hypothetical protein
MNRNIILKKQQFLNENQKGICCNYGSLDEEINPYSSKEFTQKILESRFTNMHLKDMRNICKSKLYEQQLQEGHK